MTDETAAPARPARILTPGPLDDLPDLPGGECEAEGRSGLATDGALLCWLAAGHEGPHADAIDGTWEHAG